MILQDFFLFVLKVILEIVSDQGEAYLMIDDIQHLVMEEYLLNLSRIS